MPKISIIVPVYNVEKYLERCIDSILNQTFKDIEIILIDDGSTDKSGLICDMYAKKDERIIVIHKVNGGQSEARNLGIEMAKGEFIGFVDGDDEIESDMYDVLYNIVIENNADISTGRTLLIKDGNELKQELTNKIRIYSNKEAIEVTYNGGLSGYSPCNKLYKHSLFEKNKFPKGRIYEDASVLYKLYMNSKKIVFIDKYIYTYIRREGSTTNSPFSEKRFDIVDMFNEKYEYMEIHYPEMCKKIKSLYYISLRNIIVDIVNESTVIKNYKSIKKVSKIIREELIFICDNELISNRHKQLAKVLAYFPILPVIGYKIMSYKS